MDAELNDLKCALDRGDLFPCFQPIVELRTGQLAGFEILARWKHPQHGLVLPSNFISLAEQNGLIGSLMTQVTRKAFQSAPMLHDSLMLSLNVSPFQLHDPSLPGQIQKLANEAEFPMSRMHIEITESALVDNIELAKTITQELKQMGCKLAMDDFGTGYASLRHLGVLQFDKLKIDRSFVSSMMEKRESRKIVAAIIGLGHSLGLINVAEGVETQEQADMLQLLGCEMGQGWLYGKPQPAESIPQIVAAAPREFSRYFDSLGKDESISGLEALPTQRLAHLKAIYDGSPIGMCYLDLELRYVSINQRLAEMNSVPAAAHIGRTFKEVLPELFSRVEPYLLRALNGEALSRVEVCKPADHFNKPQGTTLFTYQPAVEEGGEVIGVSLTAMEVTEWTRTGWQKDEKTGSCACFAALGFDAPQTQITSLLANIVGKAKN
jgi:EAL domain-containing protein (putative c-di-GMP-specific phosphodiesterase class I)